MEKDYSENNPFGEDSGVELYDIWHDKQLTNE